MKTKKILLTILMFLAAILTGVLIQKFIIDRTQDVDLFKQASIIYEGTNTKATAKVEINKSVGYDDKKLDEYLEENVTYTISPNKDLKNGDVITLSAKVDENILADSFGYKPLAQSIKVTVSNLGEYVSSIDSIKNIDELDKKAQELLNTKVSTESVTKSKTCITSEGPKEKPSSNYYRQLEGMGYPAVKGQKNAVVFMYEVTNSGSTKFYAVSYYDLIINQEGNVTNFEPLYNEPLKVSKSYNDLYNSISMFYAPKFKCQ